MVRGFLCSFLQDLLPKVSFAWFSEGILVWINMPFVSVMSAFKVRFPLLQIHKKRAPISFFFILLPIPSVYREQKAGNHLFPVYGLSTLKAWGLRYSPLFFLVSGRTHLVI